MMEIKRIIEKLSKEKNVSLLGDYINELSFTERFNTLREIIYHIDVFLAEKEYDSVKKLLDISDELSLHLNEGNNSKGDDDARKVHTLKIIAKKKRVKYYEAMGDPRKAIDQYLNIIGELQIPEEETFLAEILMEIGIIEEQTGRKKEAITKFDRAAKIYKRKNDDFNYTASLFNCAHVLYDMNKYREAESYCRRVINYHRDTGKTQSPIAHSFLEMANIFEILSKDKEARTYYEKALHSYRQLNDRVKMSDILNRIGSYEVMERKFTSAASLFHESLELKRTIDFQQGKANYFLMIADVLNYAGNKEKALDYYNIAYHYYNEAGIESKKTVIKHKIFRIVEKYKRIRRDMGTFLEKFELMFPKEDPSKKIERIDYRTVGIDGIALSKQEGWKFHESSKVNRKFLVYLLRNLSRVYMKLGREKDYLKFFQIRSMVEKAHKKSG
ncbi:MAG: tetratricopeptide repeat protein [Candidatus Eremiobacteraeota bacterium]|nr:tetratricopeptide repeat protein [Candidatus Eremiobacteraeota bacterium]